MTSFSPKTAATATLAALAIAGSAGVPAVQAGPIHEPIAHATPDLRVHMRTSSLAGTTSPPAATPASEGPDWTAIALGAISGAGFVVVLIGAGSVATRRSAMHRRTALH
jgi:hypothetical protein